MSRGRWPVVRWPDPDQVADRARGALRACVSTSPSPPIFPTMRELPCDVWLASMSSTCRRSMHSRTTLPCKPLVTAGAVPLFCGHRRTMKASVPVLMNPFHAAAWRSGCWVSVGPTRQQIPRNPWPAHLNARLVRGRRQGQAACTSSPKGQKPSSSMPHVRLGPAHSSSCAKLV